MPRGKKRGTYEEAPADTEPVVSAPAPVQTSGRWVANIYYTNHIGRNTFAVRYFDDRYKCEFSIKEILTSGITVVGGHAINVVPAHMILGVTYYDSTVTNADTSS